MKEFFKPLYQKIKALSGKLAIAVMSLLMACGILAAPALAATSESDVPECEHQFTEWVTTKQAGNYGIGQRVRDCELCGITQKIPTLSPLMLIIAAVLVIIALTLLFRGLTKAAGSIGKFLKKFCFWLFVAFVIAFFLGVLLFTLSNEVPFGTAIVQACTDMLGAKAFIEKAGVFTDAYGQIGGMVMNGLFYGVFVAIIAFILAFIKWIFGGAKKAGKAVKDKAVEVKDKITEVVS